VGGYVKSIVELGKHLSFMLFMLFMVIFTIEIQDKVLTMDLDGL
jgi:hypothetical protein